VTPFAPDQWVVLILVFLLGLLIGMFMMAGNKWKRRYHDEVRAREELERENERLRRDEREMDSLRGAAARDRDRDNTRPMDRGPL
jgi:uncharacterized membrane-anchored protein YhcB (DUF1043 family)